MKIPYSKGSEWRKWDLHIHAPTSIFDNNFKDKDSDTGWDNYFKTLESLEDISVLGITDYFSIDGYKKVKEYKDQGNLNNIDLILPNIELRISTWTPAGRAINFHCIFNPEYEDEIESAFFNKINFTYNGREYSCTKPQLIQLGKAYTSQVKTSIETQKDYENKMLYEGSNQFKVSHTELFKVFKSDKVLRDNCFLIIPNSNKDGNSGIKDANYNATRYEIYRQVDAIFSSNTSDRNHFLGLSLPAQEQKNIKNEQDRIDKIKKNKKDIIKQYGSFKPCIHGSDAHDNNKICKPDQNRFTWIKADPTFEGLKQITYEPEDRVYIGKNKPEPKGSYDIIQSLKINHNNFAPSYAHFWCMAA